MSVLEERVKRLREHAASLRSMGSVFKDSTSDVLELATELERRAEALEHPIYLRHSASARR